MHHVLLDKIFIRCIYRTLRLTSKIHRWRIAHRLRTRNNARRPLPDVLLPSLLVVITLIDYLLEDFPRNFPPT